MCRDKIASSSESSSLTSTAVISEVAGGCVNGSSVSLHAVRSMITGMLRRSWTNEERVKWTCAFACAREGNRRQKKWPDS